MSVPEKAPPPAAKSSASALADGAAPLLTPWLAFLAGAFCFIAAGFRFTADETNCFSSMNVELPAILEIQVEWGAKLGVVFLAVGLALLLLTQWHPRSSPRTRALVPLGRRLAQLAAVGAVLTSVLILYSGDLIFMKLQASLSQ